MFYSKLFPLKKILLNKTLKNHLQTKLSKSIKKSPHKYFIGFKIQINFKKFHQSLIDRENRENLIQIAAVVFCCWLSKQWSRGLYLSKIDPNESFMCADGNQWKINKNKLLFE